jgi:hypothetical protein
LEQVVSLLQPHPIVAADALLVKVTSVISAVFRSKRIGYVTDNPRGWDSLLKDFGVECARVFQRSEASHLSTMCDAGYVSCRNYVLCPKMSPLSLLLS